MAEKLHDDARFTFKHWQRDLPASLVVFLVALPLCMGVAIASGAPISAGLITGIVGGLVVGFLSGSPLQVSGPAAGLTVIVYALIQTHGIEKLGICVLAAGALQLVAGYLKLGQWFRAVSPAVIQGMLAGIGVLIFASQFHVMVDDKPRHSGIENLLTIPHAVVKSFPITPLGSAEERSEATRELRDIHNIHLEQTKMQETVHHLLSGIESHKKGNGGHGHDEKPAAATPSQEQLATHLQELKARQAAIAQSLATFAGGRAPEQHAAAAEAVNVALADLEKGDIFAARDSQDAAEGALANLLAARKNHSWAAITGLITILTIISWKAISVGRLKLIPGPLVAVVVATVLAALVGLPILYVEVPNNLADEVYFPTLAELGSLVEPAMWIVILQLAIIASAETLLCAAAVDQLHTGPRTQFDRELKAQGIGNMICGLLCALPMTGVIVRSSANLQAGGKTRLSSIFHGLWLLLFVAAFAWLLRYIPQATLAGILVYTGYKLVDLKAVKALARRGESEVAIYVATVVTIVATDLLIGVLVGLGLSLAKLLWVFSHLEMEVQPGKEGERRYTIHLRGSATFLKLPILARALEQVPPDSELHVNVEHLDYIDAACLDLLENWESQNRQLGARLVIDSESLQARFWRRRSGILPHHGGYATNGDGQPAEPSIETHRLVSPRKKQSPI